MSARRPKPSAVPARSPRASRPLAGRVAVVAGATRGAGRGIARALGEAGATVYCTGRSVRGRPSPYGRPETIDDTAELVTAAGGTGVAVRVDHTVEDEVRALFARVAGETGRLDVVVDSVAGEDPGLGGWTSVWDTDLAQGPGAIERALFSHVITAKHAAAAMKAARRGLIVEVSEGDMLFGGGNVLADLVKTGLKALAVHLSEELRTHRVAAVAVTPGFLRSESMLRHFGVTEDNWRDGAARDPNFLESETPLFLGRGVAALAADRRVLEQSGHVLSSWELGRVYGIVDEDGSPRDWGRHWQKQVVPSMSWLRSGLERHVAWLDALADRGRDQLGVAPRRADRSAQG